jgi:hypothetical protein
VLVTDNNYPKFYGVPDNPVQQPVYMVACAGARPVFKFEGPPMRRRMQWSSVYGNEQGMQIEPMQPEQEFQLLTDVPAELATAMLAFYSTAEPTPCF